MITQTKRHVRLIPRGCVTRGRVFASSSHPQPTPSHNYTYNLRTYPMSTSNQASSASASNSTAIFQAAHDEYKKFTGSDLDTHPFASELDSCNSPDGVLNVLQKQAQTCNRSRKGDEKLLEWLNPTVNVLFAFSATLGEGIGLVSPFVLSSLLCLNICFSAILTREANIYRHRCSPRGGSLHGSPACVH
jgi:hypothetical protein